MSSSPGRPLRMGIALRTIDEKQGIGIYTRNLVPKLLQADRRNEYVLVFRSTANVGLFADRPNVTEVVVRGPVNLLWDQIGMAWIARKHDLDVLFSPKFTVPVLSGRGKVMMLHGVGYFSHPQDFGRGEVAYNRLVLPWFCRRADHLISNSESTTRDAIRHMSVVPEKITTNPLAADDIFEPVTAPETLAAVRRKYGLPERFVLTVTKYFRGKNVPSLIEAWAGLPEETRGGLVLVGRHADRYLDDLGLRGSSLARDIVAPGWIEQKDLPAIYSLARVFAFPSSLESFGIPVLEAMCCGCPVIASNTGATPEITEDCAILVDPTHGEELASALRRVLEDDTLRAEMTRKGLERARRFSWDAHARRTLAVLEEVGRRRRDGPNQPAD